MARVTITPDIWEADSSTQIAPRSTAVTTIQGNTGGLTIVGGTASGDDLTLSSTSNATKGNIYLGSSTGVNFDQTNTYLGVGTVPVCGLHVNNGIAAVTWADTIQRNTAAYFYNAFSQTLPVSLSGMFGVDSVFTATANTGVSVNSAFYSLALAGTFNYTGVAQRGMVGQVAFTGSGTVSSQSVGLQGKLYTPSTSTATLTATTNAAIEGFVQIQGTTPITGAAAIATSFSLPNLAATATDLYGLRVPTPSKGAAYTVTNFTAVKLDDNTMTVATNKIGFHQAGTNYHNRFVGNTTFGTEATPTAKIDLYTASTTTGVVAQRWVYSTDTNYTLSLSQVASILLNQWSFDVVNNGTTYSNNLVLDRGKVAIGATTPTQTLSFGGNVTRTLGSERHTTANTAGNSLTINGGGATSAATDKDGGSLLLTPGISTGTGRAVTGIKGYTTATATGTGDNTQFDHVFYNGFKALTDGVATNLVSCTLANNTTLGLSIRYWIDVFDGTDVQVETGEVKISATNKAGTVANNTATEISQQAATAGTLTTAWAVSAANPAVISVNADTSLTPSAGYPRIRYIVENFSGQAITIQ